MEPESRDAVSHGTAGLGSGFKDGYIVIAASQFPRSCHAGRAAADDGHTTFCFTADRLRQEAAVQGHVRYEAFEFADFDVFAFFAEDAVAFALLFSRTDAAADSRQITAVIDVFSSGAEIAQGHGMDELRDFIFNGAAFAALRYFAIQAAFGFGNGFGQGIIGIMHDFFMERSQPVLGIGHEGTHLSGL